MKTEYCNQCKIKVEVPPGTKDCPNCGKMLDSVANRQLLTCLGVVVLIFVGICIIPAIVIQERQPDIIPLPVRPDISATVRYAHQRITVTNNDSWTWREVEMTLNPGLIAGYRYRRHEVNPGETVVILASDFTTSGGVRFNPAAKRPTSMLLLATDGTGRERVAEFRW